MATPQIEFSDRNPLEDTVLRINSLAGLIVKDVLRETSDLGLAVASLNVASENLYQQLARETEAKLVADHRKALGL